MFQNYLKTALRNMARYKGYTILNVSGLTIGLATCFLLFLWVKDELAYDRFHPGYDQIYRSQWKARFGENEWEIPLVPVPLAGTLEDVFPEVEHATQVYEGAMSLKKDGDFIREPNVLFVDDDFFRVFTVEPIAGNPATALKAPNTLLLTEETAHRYFGTSADVVGKTIRQNDGTVWQIGGIIKQWPEQSHLRFDFLAALQNLPHIERRKADWGSASCLTYFATKAGSDPAVLNDKLSDWVRENQMQDPFWKQGNNFTSFPFEPITDIHLKPNLTYIWIFGIIALFILVVAGINFINLATARSLTRAREVGVRKALGSSSTQLVGQFFTEAFVYVLLSTVLGVLVAITLLPFFNEMAGKNLHIDFLNTPFVWLLAGGLILVSTLLTGAFPAAVLSKFNPAKVLKGDVAGSGGKSRLRQGLVVLQFCISAALIISTLIVKNQMDYLQSCDLGFDQEQVLIIREANALGKQYMPFMERLRTLPAVERVSVSQFLPGDGFDSTIFLPEQPSNYKETSLSYTHVDPEFVDALKLRLVQGRNFDLRFKTDSTAVLINQTAAQRLGWDNPVGKKLSWGGSPGGEVVGVVADFNFFSLHHAIEPLVMRMAQRNVSNILVRLRPGNVAHLLSGIESAWKELAPQAPMEYAFLDQNVQKQYEKEQRMSVVFLLFAGLSIFIACLGLFGLSAFMVSQRTREIGIRKVLGATTSGIVRLLSVDFLILIVIALLLAAPIAYMLMEKWLHDFAYRITVSWWVFVLAGLIVTGVALFTVSFQSIKAALANPVRSLKNE